MPADAGEKTESPTPRRLADAREKGQVAKSADLSAAIGLLAGLVLLKIFGDNLFSQMMSLMNHAFSLDRMPADPLHAFTTSWYLILGKLLTMLGPIMLALFLVAIVVNLLQIGFLVSAKPITPSADKISPLQGFKRLFSARSAMRLVMSLIKVTIIGAVAWWTISNYMPQLVGMNNLTFTEIVALSAKMMFVLGLKMGAVLLVLAILDFAFQKLQLLKDLRMTKEEVKEELKRMEGDPIMRQRRRNVARQLAMQRMSQAVPKADVVITNPTELAVALKYDHDEMDAPKVVAKGAGYIAARIREIAAENGVPLVERRPLARALYKACEVGDTIPEELFKAVAEVLAYVFELAGKGYRRGAVVR